MDVEAPHGCGGLVMNSMYAVSHSHVSMAL